MLCLFSDIAIAAPFEDNGAVYIFNGGLNGLSSKPTQILAAPHNDLVEPFTVHMFGHGLSKGVDIDNNKYLGIYIKKIPRKLHYIPYTH